MISSKRILVAALIVASGAGARVWWNGRDASGGPTAVLAPQPPADVVPHVPSVIPPRAGNTAGADVPVVRSAPPPPASGVFRCEDGGRTIYQAEPCRRGQRQVEVGQGTVSVVPASRVVHAPPAPPLENGRPGAAFARVEAPRFSLVDHERCQWLQRRIDEIDSRARAKSTEPLRHRRRELVEEMDRLRCETWPS